MISPSLCRILPRAIRPTLYYRFFHNRHSDWPHLFESASLDFAPGAKLVNLKIGDVISGNIAFTGFYELDLSKRISALAKKGGLLVDVGANMGYFSALWAGANSANRVVAFEASPRNISFMKANMAANHFESRIHIIPMAAGHRAGSVWFTLGPEEQTGWGGVSNSAGDGKLQVPMARLDEVLSDEDIAVLKIDVEGAEAWVLQGCEALLRKKRIKLIFFEQNPNRMAQLGIKPDEADAFLRSVGYVCRPIDSTGQERIAMPAGENG